MRYDIFKKLTQGFLAGDYTIPDDNDVVLALLQGALIETAMRANSVHLMTMSESEETLRLGPGDYLIRMPKLPVDDVDELDIEEELIFVVARLFAASVSAANQALHMQLAERMILDYNGKTYEIIEQMQEEVRKTQLPDREGDCYMNNTGEFMPCCDENATDQTDCNGNFDTEFTI